MWRPLARRLSIAASACAAIVVAGIATLYLLTVPAESVATGKCTTTACGPLMIADCNAQFDGPLLIYTRVPARFLADCGYWSQGTSRAWFCSTVLTMASGCAPSAAPNSAVEDDAYL